MFREMYKNIFAVFGVFFKTRREMYILNIVKKSLVSYYSFQNKNVRYLIIRRL